MTDDERLKEAARWMAENARDPLVASSVAAVSTHRGCGPGELITRFPEDYLLLAEGLRRMVEDVPLRDTIALDSSRIDYDSIQEEA